MHIIINISSYIKIKLIIDKKIHSLKIKTNNEIKSKNTNRQEGVHLLTYIYLTFFIITQKQEKRNGSDKMTYVGGGG